MRLTVAVSIFLINIAFLLTTAVSSADDLPAHDTSVCNPDGIALGGYDVVAYHLLNDAILGNTELVVEHEELTYRFSSEEHKQLFEAEPLSYLPHFQGWCAIALARNRLTCPDYKNFKVENGKLLLFETITFVNGRNVWNSDPIKNLISAEQNYKRILEQ